MPEETSTGGEGERQDPPQGQQQQAGGQQGDEWDPDRARHTIETLRGRENEWKRDQDELAALREFKRKQEEEGMTENQRLAAEVERLKAENEEHARRQREATLRNAFFEEAEKAGAKRPQLLFGVAEGLELDDNGKLKNTAGVFRGLREQYPELFAAQGRGDGGRGREGNGAQSTDEQMDSLFRSGRR